MFENPQNNSLPDFSEVYRLLKKRAKPMKSYATFEIPKGLFAVFYFGKNFPLRDACPYVEIYPMIYIYKIHSVEKDEIFLKNITDIPILRKYIGSILADKFLLRPTKSINHEGYKNDTFLVYKDNNEEFLDNWMLDNLSISFVELGLTDDEIEVLLEQIVFENRPLFNMEDCNPNFLFREEIKALVQRNVLMTNETRIS